MQEEVLRTCCFKKGVSLVFIPTLSNIIFLVVFGIPVCVLSICTISISILCVSREELSLIESNQQICDFCK